MRVSEPLESVAAAGGQPAKMEMNTDVKGDIGGNATNDQTGTKKLVRNPAVERDGGASCQLDSHQLQPMDVSLDRKVTTTSTKQKAGTQWTTNNVESCFGGLKSVAGHQDTMTGVSPQRGQCTGINWGRDKHIAKRFIVIRVKQSEAGTPVRVAAIPSEAGICVRRLTSIEVNQHKSTIRAEINVPAQLLQSSTCVSPQNTNKLIFAHQPRTTELESVAVRCIVLSGARRAA